MRRHPVDHRGGFGRRALALCLVAGILVLLGAACAARTGTVRSDAATSPPAAQSPALPPSDGLRIGAARLDISPTKSVMMGGYGVYFISRVFCRWSQGVHDPLYATALFLQKGDQAVLFISLDLVGLVAPDVDDLRAAVAARVPIPADRVVVSSNHPHHGPDTIGLWGTLLPPLSGRDESYMRFMKDQAARAAEDAYRSARPAKLYYAVGELAGPHQNTLAKTVPDAPIDHTLTVLRAVDGDGKTIATLTNWACHPTTEGEDNRLISSDWVGGFYKWMAAKVDGVPMYVNGSIGASIQPFDPERELYAEGHHFIWTDVMGRRVAEAAAALLPKMTEADVDSIACASATFSFPMRNKVYRAAGQLGLMPYRVPKVGQPLSSRVTAARVGPIRFGTVPGEIAPRLGNKVREALGGSAQVIVGLGQDWLGYIIDPAQYADKRYSYEKMLCAGPELGPAVVQAHQELAAQAAQADAPLPVAANGN